MTGGDFPSYRSLSLCEGQLVGETSLAAGETHVFDATGDSIRVKWEGGWPRMLVMGGHDVNVRIRRLGLLVDRDSRVVTGFGEVLVNQHEGRKCLLSEVGVPQEDD